MGRIKGKTISREPGHFQKIHILTYPYTCDYRGLENGTSVVCRFESGPDAGKCPERVQLRKIAPYADLKCIFDRSDLSWYLSSFSFLSNRKLPTHGTEEEQILNEKNIYNDAKEVLKGINAALPYGWD
jgi:hypothetical protein